MAKALVRPDFHEDPQVPFKTQWSPLVTIPFFQIQWRVYEVYAPFFLSTEAKILLPKRHSKMLELSFKINILLNIYLHFPFFNFKTIFFFF